MATGVIVPTEAYATLSDVALFLPGRSYNANSHPSAAQCEQILKDVAQVINARLRGAGYSPPLTDTNDIQILKHMNSIGAAMLIEAATLGTVQGDSPVIETYRAEYERLLKDLTDGKFTFSGAGDATALDADGQDDLDTSGDRAHPVFVNSSSERSKQF